MTPQLHKLNVSVDSAPSIIQAYLAYRDNIEWADSSGRVDNVPNAKIGMTHFPTSWRDLVRGKVEIEPDRCESERALGAVAVLSLHGGVAGAMHKSCCTGDVNSMRVRNSGNERICISVPVSAVSLPASPHCWNGPTTIHTLPPRGPTGGIVGNHHTCTFSCATDCEIGPAAGAAIRGEMAWRRTGGSSCRADCRGV